MTFNEVVDRSLQILRSRTSVSYRALQIEFDLSDDLLDALREELVDVLGVAQDVDGRMLVWREGAQSPPQSVSVDVSQPEAEWRQLTVLLCDLVGSTPLSAQLDPEDLRSLMRRYQAICDDVIRRFEGHISQWIGDGVVVYFGYPQAHEDDARRAVQTGLVMLSEIGELAASVAEETGVQLAARVGIHTGSVVVGDIGAGSQQETLAFGETPNIAARIEAFTEPGTVAVSAATHELVRGYFTFQDLGEQTLKGVSEPIRVYRALRPSQARGRFDLVSAEGLVDLVDRDVERAVLDEARARVERGASAAVLLSGEAGIGKSRMVHYAKESVPDTWTVLQCPCSAYHRNSAFYPLVEAIRAWWDLDAMPSPEAALGQIEAAVRACPGLPADETIPLLANLLGVPYSAETYPTAGIAPGRQRQLTLNGLVELLCREADGGAVLCVVEDLHWVDPSTLEWLALFMDAAAACRVWLLMTCRPEFEVPWADRAELTTVTIEGLKGHDAAQLVRLTSGLLGLPDDVVANLAARTDGVPLYIEELTKTVLESDAWKAGQGEAGSRALDALDDEIPNTLYGCLMARIDRLDRVRVVAQIAAMIGRQFDYRLIRQVARIDEGVLNHCLDQLLKAQLLYREGQGDDAIYVFRHALVQEAAGQALLRSKAQEYHGRIGDALVDHFGDRAAAQPEIVALHFTEADRPGDAVPHWIAAGRLAIERSANAEAISHLSTALELLEALPEGPERDGIELVLQVLHAVPLTLTRGWASPEVGAAYRRAQELTERVGDTPHLFPTLVGVFTYYLVRGRFHEAADMARSNLDVALRIGDPELILEAEHDMGTARFYLGNLDESATHFERVRELYDPEKHHHHVHMYGKDPLAVAEVHRAFVRWHQGYPEEGRRLAEEMIRHTERWMHPFSHIWAHSGLAIQLRAHRDSEAMQRTAAIMLEQGAEQGFVNWVAQGLVFMGWSLALQGQHDEGIAKMREGIGLWQMTGAELLTPFLLGQLAEGHQVAGQHAEGLATVRQALDQVERTGERWWEPDLHRIEGELLLAVDRSNHEQAERSLERALDIATKRGSRSFELRVATSLARLKVDRGQAEEARRLLHPACASFDPSLETADLLDARALLASLPQS